MEALSFLYQDQCPGVDFGICTAKGVQMAWSADQPSIFVFNLKNYVWAHMGEPIQQHYSGGGEFILQTVCHNWGDKLISLPT